MALPPERVNIKRKRGAEAVDVLFLQDKKRPRFIFQKVTAELKPNIFAPTTPLALAPGQAAGKSTPVASRPVSMSREASKRPDVSKRSSLREFRLRPVADGRVKKSGSPKKNVAIFYETRASLKDQLNTQRALKPAPTGPEKSLLTPHKRLRPRASAAEIEWRERQWGSASGSRSTSRAPAAGPEDPEQLRLAAKLSAFALEATNPTGFAGPSNVAGEPADKAKSPLKFQPKPAPPRDRNKTDSRDGSVEDSESESDYEYDTYIRLPVAGDEMEVDWSPQGVTLPGNSLGVLIIEDEDEELWATYAIDDEEDDRFDTDEEDENAEDYYGNDYPEDELESDDEYGRAAYGYRYAGSDDEQFDGEDADEVEWSDSEDRPSRLTAPRVESWANEFASPIQHRGLNPY